MTNNLAPIALFAYNRPWHVRQTVEALKRNEMATESDLYAFSDGPKSEEDAQKVEVVRNFLKGLSGFRSVKIIAQPSNLGLAQSIIDGVTGMFQQHGRVIIIEDDLVTSPYFLRYMNEALEFYENDPDVISIHGYIYPVQDNLPETFFIKGADCWGWATWKRGWKLFNPNGRGLLAELESTGRSKEFDFNGAYAYTDMLRGQIAGVNHSWAIRWYASAFLQDKLTLYPGRSLVHNIGRDSTGTHRGAKRAYDIKLAERPVTLRRLPVRENQAARFAIERFLSGYKYPEAGVESTPKLQQMTKKSPKDTKGAMKYLESLFHDLASYRNEYRKLPLEAKGLGRLPHLISLFPRWREHLEIGNTILKKAKPWIPFEASDRLEKFLTDNARVYEFGCGGSTVFLAGHAREVISVEHDPGWGTATQQHLAALGIVHCQVRIIPPTPRTNPEIPDCTEPSHYATSDPTYADSSFREYASSIDEFEDESFDLVYVDGRSRPACVAHSIAKVKAGGLLLLDNSERGHYAKAIDILQSSRRWRQTDYFGPGPHNHYFWKCSIFQKLKSESSKLESSL